MAVGRFGEEVMFDVMLAGLPSIPHGRPSRNSVADCTGQGIIRQILENRQVGDIYCRNYYRNYMN